ncbi:MAG: hypothetical protein KA340_08600 [Saprospiraceae bacterium]|nr:hypothetical protein [Saprospiraceae bacterium]
MLIYDYIIIGAGAAGLSLADRLCDPAFAGFNILVIDKEIKTGNDRTWCSWYKKPNRYDFLAQKRWKTLHFVGPGGEHIKLDPAPYDYRMLLSAPFYQHIHDRIEKSNHVHFIQAAYHSHHEKEGIVEVVTDQGSYACKHLFSSVFTGEIDKKKHVYTDQHFKGWVIETPTPAFDDTACTFMDFSIDQGDEVRFMYVLPHSPTKALVELAVFSTTLWSQKDYDKVVGDYIQTHLGLTDYQITETEFGIIPMTSYPFEKNNSPLVTHIGSAGGAVKASSGYAFDRIQVHSDAIAQCILKGEAPGHASRVFKARHKLYDATLLQVLDKKRYRGADFFLTLFQRNPASRVFDFLNEETTLWEEVQLMAGSPKHIFAWSMGERVVKG